MIFLFKKKGLIFLGEPAVNCQGCRLNYQQPRWITNIKPMMEKLKISCCVIIPFWKWNFEMATHLSYTEMQHILTLCPEDKWHLWGWTFLLVWEVRNCYIDWILTRISMLHQRFHGSRWHVDLSTSKPLRWPTSTRIPTIRSKVMSPQKWWTNGISAKSDTSFLFHEGLLLSTPFISISATVCKPKLPLIVVFLIHCGCTFPIKKFQALQELIYLG